MKKRKFFGVNVGSSSILLIFIVLSLISLGILSLSTTLSDYRLSNSVATRQVSYYRACNLAEDKLRELDYTFYKAACDLSESEFYAHFEDFYSYCFEISDLQSLIVTIVPSYKPKNSSYYEITRWQITVNDDLEYDENLLLFSP